MTTASFDRKKADAFADELLGMLNGGSLMLMTSIGHRTGLFDAMAGMPLATSAEIAKAAGLNERYAREWLGAMATGRFVECGRAAARSGCRPSTPPSSRAPPPPTTWRPSLSTSPLLGMVEDRIVNCFRNGGGVPYSGFPRFQAVMAEESGQTIVPALTDAILPLVPGLTSALGTGIGVLDVGCGSGRALNIMAKAFPKSRFHGLRPLRGRDRQRKRGGGALGARQPAL